MKEVMSLKHTYLIMNVFLFIVILFVSCSEDKNQLDNPVLETIEIADAKTRAAYVFPSVSEIIQNQTVINAMNNAWSQTKSNASSAGRNEYGFYIYYNHTTKNFYVGTLTKGPLMTGCVGTSASISLGKVTNNLDVCAFFHTHTPLTYCSSGLRATGPSSSDVSFANTNNLPGIIYDYSSSTIIAGHNLNDNAKLYTFGPNKRPDLYY